MALSVKKKAEAEVVESVETPKAKVAPVAHKPTGTASFIKRGAKAKQAMEMEDKQAELRQNKLWRYWLKKDSEGGITFLDGDLTTTGDTQFLDAPYLYEHQLQLNGSWDNHFVCLEDETGDCPLCASGNKPSYIASFTIIDHTPYKTKDGKVVENQVKLFIAKRETIKLLTKIAIKRGGLRGCVFDVVRSGNNSASVGSNFDFTEKLSDAQLKALYPKAEVVNYDEYFSKLYLSADQLAQLGLGAPRSVIGAEVEVSDPDYSDLI